MDAVQHVVFAAVVALRLIVPLFIPRFPLPAILASLVIDGVDQTIFQKFGMESVLDNYQSYDKSLDIYYLAIAYTSTLRNWLGTTEFEIGRFLWYWRLVGVLGFELSQWRPLLLIFPNTFEYFFIAYEAIRTLWRPDRLSKRTLILMAAGIWIFIKLPQEWWIHVAQLDVTDEIKAHPVLATVVFTLLGIGLAVAAWATHRYAPAPDWRFTVDVDAHQPRRRPDVRPEGGRSWLITTIEKVLLIGMITVIFGQILPSDATPIELVLGSAVIIVLNAGVTEWLEWRRWVPHTIFWRFLLTTVVNAILFETLILMSDIVVVNRASAAFMLLLLSLIITLYDHFRAIRHGQSGKRDLAVEPEPAAGAA